MVFRDENSLCLPDHLQRLWVDLPDKQRRTMSHDVIVVGSFSGVDEKQAAANRDPVLLRVVTAKDFTVIERPLTNRLESQTVFAAGDEGRMICSQCEVVTSVKDTQ